MFRDDAVSIGRVKTAAKDGLNVGGLIQGKAGGPALDEEPAESAPNGGEALGLISWGGPDLTEDSEMGRETQVFKKLTVKDRGGGTNKSLSELRSGQAAALGQIDVTKTLTSSK